MKVLGAIAMLLGVAVVALAFALGRVSAPQPVAPPVAPVVVTPRAPAPGPTDVPGPTRQEIAARVERSVVHLRCGEQQGAGFFIGPDQLITNAHVLCTGKLPLIVTLKDGRNLLGTVSARDDWLDLARVDVPGADAEPLPIGDTTALRAGDEVGFIGSPKGLAFTVHGGRVSHVGRGLYGVAYVQLDAQVNPGNSGGPLFDAKGNVLGLVAMKVVSSEGIGLALPIEYARAPVEGPALERWQQTLKQVDADDVRARADEAQRMAPGKPQLVAIQRVEARGIAAVVIQRWTGTPHALLHDFTLKPAGCLVRASVSGWVPLAEAIEKAQDPRRIAWMLKHKLADGVYAGAGLLQPIDCAPARLTGQAQLSVAGDAQALTIEASDLKVPLEVAVDDRLEQAKRAQQEAQKAAADEASWRGRFRAARSRLDELDAQTKEAQRVIAHADDVARRRGELPAELRVRYNEARDTMARAPGQRSAAEADLHELERQAAHEAVPLEWRR